MSTMMTMTEAAEKWGVSYTTVRKWVGQGRVKTETVGHTVLVLDPERPAPAVPGTLSATQRKGWNYGKRYRPEDEPPQQS